MGSKCADIGKAFKIVPGIKPFSPLWHIFQRLFIMCHFLSWPHILTASSLPGTVLGSQKNKWMNKAHNLCVKLHISKCPYNYLFNHYSFPKQKTNSSCYYVMSCGRTCKAGAGQHRRDPRKGAPPTRVATGLKPQLSSVVWLSNTEARSTTWSRNVILLP